MKNRSTRVIDGDGDLFVFDSNGAGLRKINRQGQGSEEYLYLLRATLDEYNNEIFVSGISSGYNNKMMVYDLFGTFKRIFATEKLFSPAVNFDRDHLLCRDGEFEYFDERQNTRNK